MTALSIKFKYIPYIYISMGQKDPINNSKDKLKRRGILSAIGSGISLTGLSTITAGQATSSKEKKFIETIERANRLRSEIDGALTHNSNKSPAMAEKYNNISPQGAWKKYLQKQGYNIGTKRYKTAFRSSDKSDSSTGGQISPNKVIDVDGLGIWTELSLVYDSYVHRFYVELSFKLKFGGAYCNDGKWCGLSSGEDPKDTLALGWNENCWDYFAPSSISGTTSTSDNVSFEDDYFSLNSMGFEVDDRQMWNEYRQRDETGWGTFSYSSLEYAGIYMNSREYTDSQCNNNKDTTISAVYSHTWNGTYDSFSIGVSYPWAISISYSQASNLNSEDTTTKNDNDTPLLITKEDASVV